MNDKPLPRHPEIEQSLLAAVILDAEYRAEILDQLEPEAFYRTGHQLILRAAVDLKEKGLGADLVLMGDRLRELGWVEKIGGGAALLKLADIPMPGSLAAVVECCAKVQADADLRRLIAACSKHLQAAFAANGTAPEVIARAKSDIEKIGAGSAGRRLRDAVFEAGSFLKIDAPARAHCLFPWLWSGSYGLISGARGVGKTFFIMGALDAITRGVSFGPWECHEPVSCLYIEGELPLSDCKGRIRDMGLNTNRVAPLHILSDAYLCEVLKRPGGINLCDTSLRAELRALFLDIGAKVVVFDNLASLTPGIDENSKEEWDPVNRWMLGLRYAGISPWLVHHLGKNGDQRGTSGREDNIDISIRLTRPANYQNEDGARFVVNFSKRRIDHDALRFVNDIELQFRPDESGAYCWTFGDVQQGNKRRILEMLDKGVNQSEIAEELGISRQAVSSTKRRLLSKGFLSAKNKMTPSGFEWIQGAQKSPKQVDKPG